jgi:transposase
MPIAPKTQRKELTNLQKDEIFTLKEENKSRRATAEKLKISHQTIQEFLQRFQNRGIHESLPHTNRPRLTTTEQDQELYNATNNEPHIKYNALHRFLNLIVSIHILRR